MSATFRKANEEVRQEISNSLLRTGNTGKKLASFGWLISVIYWIWSSSMSLTNFSWVAKWYKAHAYRFKQARSVWPCTWGSWYFIQWAGSQLAVVIWASERFLELALPFRWVVHEYTPVATDTSENTTNSFYTSPPPECDLPIVPAENLCSTYKLYPMMPQAFSTSLTYS